MRLNLKGIFGAACGYAAAVVGAGFASGQEIVSFFVRYGRYSIFGIILSCIIFTLFSWCVMSVCVKNGVYNYNDFLGCIFKSKRVCRAAEHMMIFFSMASLCVMAACAGEMGYALIGAPNICGAAVFAVVCGVIFFSGDKRLMAVNSAMGAVIVIGIVFSCLFILRFREHQTFAGVNIAVSGLSYAGYNLLTAGAILAGMSKSLRSRGEAFISAAVAGIMLFIMITLVWGVLGIYYGKINLGEIPMLTMAMRNNNMLSMFYGVMLFMAVLTTGISNGFGIMDTVGEKYGKNIVIIIMLFVAVAMSGAGFAALINTVYRFSGYIGMIMVFAVIFKSFKNMKKVVK